MLSNIIKYYQILSKIIKLSSIKVTYQDLEIMNQVVSCSATPPVVTRLLCLTIG